MLLGVCYYPEHWPEDFWADDARRMAEMGISRVRIGEFAWSRIEPEPGRFEWSWLDRAIETLASAGHGIILGTPTATPPKWLVDRHPDILARDEFDRPRRFGSRRHYCFSSLTYREQCRRIVTAIAERYGRHPAVVAWQTDNEYGCHDTVVSYSAEAAAAFRRWLASRYRDVEALNAAWGTVFWSQEYRGFEEIDPPNLTVTEANPAHQLDYRRFASDEVVSFNRLQVDILRAASPGRDVVHNFMGFFTQFDHHAVAADLDLVSWDSYPLGFLEQFWFGEADKLRYARQGHPDIAAFHHDLYRGCGGGRWCVMEQQPGPVNWAGFNPAPLPGMVRLWTLEALAHGAELVSYFRWRQAPFGQEQMHAGLLRPDSVDAIAVSEVRQAAVEIAALPATSARTSRVAMLFDYQGEWVVSIQPQGKTFAAIELVFAFYSALRQLGINVDIVAPGTALDGYDLVVAPCLPIVDDALVAALSEFTGPVLLGPRSGSKSANYSIPPELPPGKLQQLIALRVVRAESLADNVAGTRWLEHVETDLAPEERLPSGESILFRHSNIRYLAAWPDAALLQRVFLRMLNEAAIAPAMLDPDLRIRAHGSLIFAFNYGPVSLDLSRSLEGAEGFEYLIGGTMLDPAGVAVWRAA